MDPHSIIETLGSRLGIPLHLNDDGLCRVLFDGDAVNFEADGESLWLIAEVAPIPAGGGSELYAAMLQANAFGKGTKGAVLSIDSSRDAVFLHRECRGFDDFPPFEAVLIDFITTLRRWKNTVRNDMLSLREPTAPVSLHADLAPDQVVISV